MNNNTLHSTQEAYVLFIDMNSFFASCEQQTNYYLRGRPVGVCVYTGKNGCVISPSVEAKRLGVKTGMRLNEAIHICPQLVPLETRPNRYREFHVKIIQVLKKYAAEVIPKSIDEAVVDLRSYKMIYKDPVEVAKKIKQDIQKEVGDWLRCSIGVAPNAFLAKLGTELQKPDGLVLITPENIDDHLSKLMLTDLPGIARGMAERLEYGGIHTPLQLRYASPEKLQKACKSIIGLHWHYRLNFAEVDMQYRDYKSMQTMRQISEEQRRDLKNLQELLIALCMTLERRMVKQEVFCRNISISLGYKTGGGWSDHIALTQPQQDGMEILKILRSRMEKFEAENNCENLINRELTSMGVAAYDFIPAEMVQYSLFENNIRKDMLRKAVYNIKDRFGPDKVMKAAEIFDTVIMKDAIGFGSVKDLHDTE